MGAWLQNISTGQWVVGILVVIFVAVWGLSVGARFARVLAVFLGLIAVAAAVMVWDGGFYV